MITTKRATVVLVLFVFILTQHVWINYCNIPSVESAIIFQELDSPYPNAVLSGDYWEKMTMAMNSMFQLATIAKEWNAAMPLPFTSDSFVYGLPTDRATGAGRLKLDTIYNIEKLFQLMEKFNIPMFTTFEEFLQTASRSVIGVELRYYKIQDSRLDHHIYNLDCNRTKTVTTLFDQLNNETMKRFLKPFHLVKCCGILASHNTSPQEMSSLCGIHDMSRVTILISNWRGIENEPRFRLFMKNFSVPYPDPRTPLPHSEGIVSSAQKLLTKKLGKPMLTKFVGVHLRSEKVLLKSNNFTVFNQCFQLIYNLTQKLTVRYPGLPVLYFGDGLTNKVFGKEMNNHNIELVQYNMTEDKGYQAQVEQAMIARAEVLILVGGGSFQLQLYTRYRTHKNTGIVYRVCDSISKNYLSVTNWKGSEWWQLP